MENTPYRADASDLDFWPGLLGDATICGACHGLRGTTTRGWRQVCACERRARAEDQARDVAPSGFDFPEVLDLCWCCGAVLVGSGTRFSRVNCTRCQSWIRELNLAAGRLLVPLGRHSLMNGVGLPAGRLIPPEEVAAFVDELHACFGAVGRHARHATRVVEENLNRWRLPADQDVALGVYLDARPTDLDRLSARAVRALLAEIVGPDQVAPLWRSLARRRRARAARRPAG